MTMPLIELPDHSGPMQAQLELATRANKRTYTMHATSNDRARITARVTAYAQQAIERAAELTATTTNQFVAQAALREAERIIEEQSIIRLCQKDMQAFLEAIDNPPPANDRLAASLKQHMEARKNGPGSKRRTIRWDPEQR